MESLRIFQRMDVVFCIVFMCVCDSVRVSDSVCV